MFRLKEAKKLNGHTPIFCMALIACLMVSWASTAWALGTSAGTSITNTATVVYTLGSSPALHTSSTSDVFDVLEIIDVTVTWQDSADVPVNTPHTDAVLTFQIVNLGNGPEDFRLMTNEALGGDNFDPAVQTLWQESNTILGLQTSGATPDTQYMGGGIALNADEAVTVYVLSDIPAALADTDTGHVQLTVEALTPGAAGAAAGTELPGAGVGGNAMVGTTNADGDGQGTYVVSAPVVTLTKSILQIVDPYGGNQPYTSAQITYRILVDVGGSGTAEGLVVTDAIPANTTYLPGSLTLDTLPQTDADDVPVDNSDFNVTNANAVTVNIGDTVAPATRAIEFSVTIN